MKKTENQNYTISGISLSLKLDVFERESIFDKNCMLNKVVFGTPIVFSIIFPAGSLL